MASTPRKPGQLPLTLPLSSQAGREDLIVSKANSVAVEMIDNWPKWPGPVTILAGPVGSGKSHLASIWAGNANAITVTGAELGKADIQNLADRNVLVEDLGSDDLLERGIDEQAMFHLLNIVYQSQTTMLITSRSWPQAWGVQLPDLQSRLRAAQLVELQEPDDELLAQVIVKLFADRQLQIDTAVVDYLVVRMERSLAAAMQVVQWMDEHSLARGSRLTRTLAGDALRTLDLN